MSALYLMFAAAFALVAVGMWRGWWKGLIHAAVPAADMQSELLQQAALARFAARLLAALVITLTAIWSYQAHPNFWVSIVFTGGFLGYVIAREAAIPAAVNAWHAGRRGALLAWGSVAGIATAMLFLSGLFEMANQTGAETSARIEASKPAAALDNEIAAARERLAGLAAYADASKADSEAAARASETQARAARISELEAQIAEALAAPVANSKGHTAGTLSAMAGDCFGAGWYAAKYCGPVETARREIAKLENGNSGAAVYGPRHTDYIGLQAHLTALEKQRAALSETGQGVQSAHRSEDKLTAEALAWAGLLESVDPEKAAWIKWAFLSFIFDVAAVLLMVSAQGNVRAAGGDPVARFRALLMAGIDSTTAAGLLTGGAAPAAIPPAQVSRPHLEPAPALDTGGRIHADGMAHLHAGEIVLNAQAAAQLDKLAPGLAEALNALQSGLNASATDSRSTDSRSTDKRSTDSRSSPLNKKLATIRQCRHCGNDFYVSRTDKFYCGDECRGLAWEARAGKKLLKGKRIT